MPDQITINRLLLHQVQAIGSAHEAKGFIDFERTESGFLVSVYRDIRLGLSNQAVSMNIDAIRCSCPILYIDLVMIFTGPVIIQPIGKSFLDRDKLKFAVFEADKKDKHPWYDKLDVEFDIIDLYGNLIEHNTAKKSIPIR